MAKAIRTYKRYARGILFAYVACWAVILGLGVALVIVPVNHDALAVRGVGVLLAAAGAVFIQQSLRWATIDVRSDSILVHELFHTSRLRVADIERFVVVRNIFSSNPHARGLAVRMRGGESMLLGDFSNDGLDGDYSIDDLVAHLNVDIGVATSQEQRAGAA